MNDSIERKNHKKLIAIRWLARICSLPALLFMGAELLFPHAEIGAEENTLILVSLGILILATFSLALAWFFESIGGWLSWSSLLLFFIVYWVAAGEFFPVYWLLILTIGIPAGLFLLHNYLSEPVNE